MHDSNGSCIVSDVLGVFPVISGFSCSDYSLYIGIVSVVASSLFWAQVTK